MTDARHGVPNAGRDVDDTTEPDQEYDQLGSDGNPFERTKAPDEESPAGGSPAGASPTETSPAEASPAAASPEGEDEDAFTADSDADFGMGIPAANDPQRLPEGPGPT